MVVLLALAVFFGAVAPSSAANLSPIDTFYPPGLNDTSYITNDTIGTYGGIYQASTYQWNDSAPYGTYDYCTMPHPRVQEYQLPGPVASGAVKANLVYLEYLQRHQRRTAYNILPGGENQAYDCDNFYPYLYGGPSAGEPDEQPIPVYAQTYVDPTNPFAAQFDVPNSTCQFPQLTIGGLLDGYQHGQDLWALYGLKLGLIPLIPDPKTTFFRSSDSPLTQESAGGVLRGIWPLYPAPIPLHQQDSNVDTVNDGYSCNARDTILSDLESTSEWNAHITATQPLQDALGSMLGTTGNSAWTSTFDHFSDNFQARLCNGYELPCSVSDPSSCVTMEQADEVFRAGDWEWNYYWRGYSNAKEYIQVTEGLFIGEVLAHLSGVQNGTSSLKYSHTFIHDGDLGPILGAMGINVLRWPAMGSNIAIELWKTWQNEFYARVLYSGQPVETIYGNLDWIPLSQLFDILQPYVPTDIISQCG